MRGRIKKTETHYKHSHESDWIFLVLLFVVAFTGILQHILHRAGLDVAANITYVVHLMAWCRCWCSRCRSASGRTWPTGRWRCTSPRSGWTPSQEKAKSVAGVGEPQAA